MEFRLAKLEDKEQLDNIYEEGSKKLRDEGSPQWQGPDKPNTDNLESLIDNKEIYVLEDKGEIVSTAIILKYDEDYEKNLYGTWITNGSYISIHRVATITTKRKKVMEVKLLNAAKNLAEKII